MTDHLHLKPHKILREDRPDGAILLRSAHEMGPVAPSTSAWLRHWAETSPTRVFLAERSGAGWRELTYADAWERVQSLAAGLLQMGLGPDAPLMILSGNSVDHGCISLAAHHVGIPTVPVAEQYSLIPGAQPRLRFVADLVEPGAVFAEDGAAYGPAIEHLGLPAISPNPATSGARDLESLMGHSRVPVDAAHATVGPDTVAKILMTSGSTSDPKGVLTTQSMMTTNQAQIASALPFVATRPPVLVDWLPWNHVFGGSYNFNLVLANGGSLYIDGGKPLPALFPKTVENLGLVSGTISFNVPVGFTQLVAAMRTDPDLRRTYFANLDMIFYAGASLPQDTWSALEDLAMQELGQLPLITSSWGLTETAPGATIQHEPARGAGIIGAPYPGVTIKLVDDGSGRMDIRVKGQNVFQSYLRNPAKTREAFDEEGYFITGDAVRFVDPETPDKGLRFDGRLGEDFKLVTGTWVQAANLRLDMLGRLAPLAADLVICGEGRDEIGLFILPNRAAIKAAGHALADDGPVCLCPTLFADLQKRLQDAAEQSSGSATRITRALILSEPPDMGEGEVTAKGNLNFARVLTRRAALLDRLYDDTDPALIRI